MTKISATNITLNGEMLKVFLLRLGRKQEPLLFNIVLEVLVGEVRQEKEIKYESKGKRLFLFTDNIIVYTENPKQPAAKLLDLSKVAWYKINMQI